MVIPKRYAKSAVLRNAIKRQGREIFRLHMGELPVCDLVLRLDRALKGREGRTTLEQKREWRIMIEALFVSVANLPRVLSAQ
jgi:ribonuclease P protein component